MEKQSNKNGHDHDKPESDEITVKKVSPLTGDDAAEAAAEGDPSENYKALYDELLVELKLEKETHLRQLAEVENFRKRLIKEKEDVIKFANESLLQELFPCLDNLDMTLTHATPEQIQKDPVIMGVNLVLRQFLQTLQKHGLEEVGAVGLTFDPNLHEAIDSKPTDGLAAGLITQVHRKGYRLHGRLLRAALVSVSA